MIFPRRIGLSLPESYKPTPERNHYLEILQSYNPPAKVKHTDVAYYGSDNQSNRNRRYLNSTNRIEWRKRSDQTA